MDGDALADLLSASDPFLVTATEALTAEDDRQRFLVIQRLLELRATPTADLSPSDRALRLIATGCLYLVLEERERRAAKGVGGGGVSPTTRRGSRSYPGDGRRRESECPPRNVRAELRLLFGAIRVCDETRPAGSNDRPHAPTVDRQHPVRALLHAIVDDAGTWQTDPLFRDELDSLLTEPASRGRRMGGRS